MGKLERKLDLELIERMQHVPQAEREQSAQEKRSIRRQSQSIRKSLRSQGLADNQGSLARKIGRAGSSYRGARRNNGRYTGADTRDGSYTGPIYPNKRRVRGRGATEPDNTRDNSPVHTEEAAATAGGTDAGKTSI